MPTDYRGFDAFAPATPDSGAGVQYDPFGAGNTYAMGYKTRIQARRTAQPAMAALAASRALFQPTLDLARRGAQEYGQLYRDEAGKNADFDLDQLRENDPQGWALLQMLTADASGGVGSGASPYEDRDVMQSIRGGQASRGMGYGQSDLYSELIGLDRASETRRLGRGRYAGDVLSLRQNYLGTNRPGSVPWANLGSPIQPTGTDDFLSLNVNDVQSRRNQKAAKQASTAAFIGGAVQTAAAVACWVAEELYGKDDPRTHLARAHVARQPDTGFWADYREHGQEWAAFLKANPALKPLVQWRWDAMWKAEQRLLAYNPTEREPVPA